MSLKIGEEYLLSLPWGPARVSELTRAWVYVEPLEGQGFQDGAPDRIKRKHWAAKSHGPMRPAEEVAEFLDSPLGEHIGATMLEDLLLIGGFTKPEALEAREMMLAEARALCLRVGVWPRWGWFERRMDVVVADDLGYASPRGMVWVACFGGRAPGQTRAWKFGRLNEISAGAGPDQPVLPKPPPGLEGFPNRGKYGGKS